MPFFSVEPSTWVGSAYPAMLKQYGAIDVVDASGKVIDDDFMVAFDTDTGLVISQLRTTKGGIIVSFAHTAKWKIKYYPAPLMIKPFVPPRKIDDFQRRWKK